MADHGAFIPSTFVWDMQEIMDIDVTSDKFKELLVRLYQNINLIQTTLNIKDSAFYDSEEFVNGQVYPAVTGTNATNVRQVFRKMVSFGALPNTAAKTVAHGIDITVGFTFTRIYGAASDTTNLLYLPIPSANPDINIRIDATNIVITTSANYSLYDTTYVILEYLKY
jgi:hypothetical protein